MSARGSAPATGADADAVIWHDAECSGYEADLPLWRELAEERAGRVLELGCGTGRVGLDLARRGHEVEGIDADAALVEAFNQRARERALSARAVTGDAAAFASPGGFALVTAPMQVVQLLDGPQQRAATLACAAAALEPGGLLAVAVADPLEGVPAGPITPPLPDVRERDGWVFSSIPVAVREEAGGVVVERVRESVSPAGELTRDHAIVRLERLDPSALEREGTATGFTPLPARRVPATDEYVGTTVVLLEAGS